MVEFQVPQYLDIEDKVIGPLTVKQFLYVLGGVGGGYTIYRIIPWKFIAIWPALCVLIAGLLLAFFKYNGKPFIQFVVATIIYYTNERLYIWQRRIKKQQVELDLSRFNTTHHSGFGVATTSTRKLDDLAFQVEAHGNDVVAKKVTAKENI